MHTWFQRRFHHPSNSVLGGLMVLSLVWIGSLQYAPAAHEHIHHDAHEEDHHCVVEIFADGIVSEVAELHVASATAVIATEIPARCEVWLEDTEHLHPPGRGPPLG